MVFPASVHADIDRAVERSIQEFVENRNSGLPRAAVLATTSNQETIVNSCRGYVRVDNDDDARDLATRAHDVTDESLFPLWSSTKLVTAIAALQLVERGEIELDADAAQYVPELGHLDVLKGFTDDGEPEFEPNTHKCTVENLITHTAGQLQRLPSLSVGRADPRHTCDAGFKYQYDPVYDKIQAKLGLTSIYDPNSTRVSDHGKAHRFFFLLFDTHTHTLSPSLRCCRNPSRNRPISCEPLASLSFDIRSLTPSPPL